MIEYYNYKRLASMTTWYRAGRILASDADVLIILPSVV